MRWGVVAVSAPHSLRDLLLADVERALRLLSEQYRAASRILEARCFAVTGSGDNYALALASPHLSKESIVVPFDPLQLLDRSLASMLAARGCVLIALSVGGRTRNVVSAAKLYREVGGKVVAVTADPSSPLAAEADIVVTLLHGGTAGGIGAGRHILAAAALAGLLGAPEPKPSEIGVECPGEGVSNAVQAGYMESIGSALYAALKAYEVWGRPVHWWSLEQLVHAPIYSVEPGRPVIIYHASFKPDYSEEAIQTLKTVGYKVYVVPGAANPATTLVSQAVWVLRCLAREKLPEEPHYKLHPGLEKLTKLIYG
jgi:fructoselysine-6-P-deglycase FrlB-like protein